MERWRGGARLSGPSRDSGQGRQGRRAGATRTLGSARDATGGADTPQSEATLAHSKSAEPFVGSARQRCSGCSRLRSGVHDLHPGAAAWCEALERRCILRCLCCWAPCRGAARHQMWRTTRLSASSGRCRCGGPCALPLLRLAFSARCYLRRGRRVVERSAAAVRRAAVEQRARCRLRYGRPGVPSLLLGTRWTRDAWAASTAPARSKRRRHSAGTASAERSVQGRSAAGSGSERQVRDGSAAAWRRRRCRRLELRLGMRQHFHLGSRRRF